MLYGFSLCLKGSQHHKFQLHHDFAVLMPEFECIHWCMRWEAEFGPITRDENKVIVGCPHWREFLSSSERLYQHSYLIIRPHSESRTPRPGRILKLKEICWHGGRSHSQHQQKNIQILADSKWFQWLWLQMTWAFCIKLLKELLKSKISYSW